MTLAPWKETMDYDPPRQRFDARTAKGSSAAPVTPWRCARL
jgi:hypothetical protein